MPAAAISFYDQNRKDLGLKFIGPFPRGSEWHRVSKSISVPPTAREAILRLGLFGATGRLSVDDIQVQPTAR